MKRGKSQLGALALLGVLVEMAGGSLSPAVEELDQYVLVIQESPSGHLTHSWRPVVEFDLSQFSFIVAFPPGVLIALIPAAALASSESDGELRFTAVAQ